MQLEKIEEDVAKKEKRKQNAFRNLWNLVTVPLAIAFVAVYSLMFTTLEGWQHLGFRCCYGRISGIGAILGAILGTILTSRCSKRL